VWPIEAAVPQSDCVGRNFRRAAFPDQAAGLRAQLLKVPDDLIDSRPRCVPRRATFYPAIGRRGCSRRPWCGDLASGSALNLGNGTGGTNWPGAGYDPEDTSSTRRRSKPPSRDLLASRRRNSRICDTSLEAKINHSAGLDGLRRRSPITALKQLGGPLPWRRSDGV
jgi:hypothetical protein